MLNENFSFKKYIVGTLAVIIVIISLFFVFYLRGISYIQINSPSAEMVSVQITQPDGSKKTFKPVTSNKIRVKNGDFTLFATSNNGSYFLTDKAPSFMRQKTVDIRFSKEKDLGFVGEPGRSCFFKNTVLVSYVCGASFANVQFQNQATVTTPQFNTTTRNKTEYLTLYESVSTKDNEYVLAKFEDKPPEDYEDFGDPAPNKIQAYYGWAILIMNAKDQIIKTIQLKDLNKSSSYRIKKSDSGLILFSQSEIYFHDINQGKTSLINIKKQEDPIVDVDIQEDKFIVAYSKPSIDPKGKNEPALLVLYNKGGQLSKKTIKQGTEKIAFCGTDVLCVKSKNLFIFSIKNNKFRQTRVVSGVNQFYKFMANILLVTDKGIINLNPSSGEGSVDLSFEPYTYLNISESKNGYLVSVRGVKKQVVVEVNLSEYSTYPLLKQIGALEKSAGVQNLSISGKIIFFTPEVPLIYDQGKKEMVYDKDVVIRTNQQIINRARELGIPFDYQLISTIR